LSDDCPALLRELTGRGLSPEAFVSVGPEGGVVHDLSGWTERAFVQSVRSGGWPTFEYLLRMREACGRYPRYVVAVSPDSPDHYSSGFDLRAASAAVLEALCRCLTYRLRGEDVRVNVLRTRTAPADVVPFAGRLGYGDTFVEPEEVAGTVLALCSGLLDGVRGQVIVVDRGAAFRDDLGWLYQRRKTLGL
jgi:NAD(P)-dependent dehydrogenase (short-subunit alcohol dehydrogenase family)